MRAPILFCMFALGGYTANAQFYITPQVGAETSKTSIEFNEHSSISPLGAKLSPQAGVRLDYKFKKAHGPYIGAALNRSITKFNFSDLETGINAYTASRGNTQLRLEGGYQVSTKPIYFKRSGSGNKSSKAHNQKNFVKKNCGSYLVRSSCGSKTKKAITAASADKGSWVRIQPSLGVAYIPSSPTSEIYTKSHGSQTSYEYNAGNWNTALISGIGFEFGKNSQSNFIVSINYLKGIGNLGSKSITAVSGNKATTASLESDASAWSVRMGIPISLSKKKPVVKERIVERIYQKKSYGEYKKQCNKSGYKPRCIRVI